MSWTRIFQFAAALAAWCILSSSAPHAQASADARLDGIVALAQQKMREFAVPGVAIGVVDNGQVTLRTLGVTNTVSADALRAAGAEVVTASLADWTVDAVKRLF